MTVTAALLSLFLGFSRALHASEYLGNNQRDGYTDARVPTKPALLWTYQERHAPKTAWPEPFGELQFIDFDYSDQVTIGKELAYFGSSADHAGSCWSQRRIAQCVVQRVERQNGKEETCG